MEFLFAFRLVPFVFGWSVFSHPFSGRHTPEEGKSGLIRPTTVVRLHVWHGTCYDSCFVWLA
jgi:hypothetical protein